MEDPQYSSQILKAINFLKGPSFVRNYAYAYAVYDFIFLKGPSINTSANVSAPKFLKGPCINRFLNIFAERIRAYESISIIGDSFMAASFEPYYKAKALKEFGAGYMTDCYDLIGRSSNQYTSNDPNFISRLRNLLVNLMQKEILLPKLIAVVLDDDLVKYLNHDGCGESKAIGRILNELMTDFRKLVTKQKEFLDKKSKRPLYPQFVWLEAPLNVNFSNNARRKKYNDRLHAVSKFHENVTILEMKKIWDPDCTRLYVGENDRYTCEGYSTYWAAVDCTMKFMDTIYFKKIENKSSKKAKAMAAEKTAQKKEETSESPDKYKWESEEYSRHRRDRERNRDTHNHRSYDEPMSDNYYPSYEGRRRLPTPPRRYRKY